MNSKTKVLINSGLYTFSSLLVKAIGFLLLPVYTLFLTPKDYGITSLVDSFTGVATYVVAFSLYSAIIRFYADFKNDRVKLKRLYGTIIIFIFCSGVVFVGLGFYFNKFIIEGLFKGLAFYPVVLIALLNLTFACLYTVHQSIMQGMQMGVKLTIRNLIVFALQVGLNLLFIVYFRLGAVGVLLATLLINVLYSVYMIYDLVKNDSITFCVDKDLLREALKYSVPLMPHDLSTMIARFAARVFINNNGSLGNVGLYSVAAQFGNAIDTVQSSVNSAFAPWFYEQMNRGDPEGKSEILILSRFLIIFYSFFYLGIGLFSQEVIILMTPSTYTMAWTVIPILVSAYSVKSIYYFHINILLYHKEAANKVFIATIIGSFIDVVLAAIVIPKYGMYGAAVSFLVAKITVVAIVVMMSKFYDDVGYRVTEMLKIVGPSLVFMGGGLYFSYSRYLTVFSWPNLLYKCVVLLAYLAFVYLTNRTVINNIIKSGELNTLFKRESMV